MARASVLFQHQLVREESPQVAKRRNVLLNSVPQIEKAYARALADPNIPPIGKSPDTAEEALRFYNAVVTDGRYIALLATEPREAAGKLNLKVSPEALNLVRSLAHQVRGPGPAEGPVEAVIAIAVVILWKPARGETVLDSSALVAHKL